MIGVGFFGMDGANKTTIVDVFVAFQGDVAFFNELNCVGTFNVRADVLDKMAKFIGCGGAPLLFVFWMS